MKKLLFILAMLPTMAFADRLGSLRSNADVALTTQTVQNRSSLQSGATFYVSSGTVANSLSVVSMLGVGVAPASGQAIKAVSSATSGTSIAVNGTANGVGATNAYGLYGWGSGATNNYALYLDSGAARLADLTNTVLAVDSNGVIISTTVTGGSGGLPLPAGATNYAQINPSSKQSGTVSVSMVDASTVTLAASTGLGANIVHGPNNSVYAGPSAGNQTGQYQVCAGVHACEGNTAIGAIGLGWYSGSGASVSGNIAIGEQSLGSASTSGSNNVAIGDNAMASVNSAGTNDNIAIGRDTLQNVTSYGENTAVGANALKATTSGFENHAFGIDALTSNTTGFRNVAVGSQALYFNVGGVSNTAIGDQAGGDFLNPVNAPNPFSSGNTFLGAASGVVSSNTVISNSVALGYNSEVGCANCAAIGTTGVQYKVGIGTTTPAYNLSVVGSSGIYSSGGITSAGNVSISSGVLLSGAAGTNGQVLTSGGAGTVPTWTTVSGSGGAGSNAILIKDSDDVLWSVVVSTSGNITTTSLGASPITPAAIVMVDADSVSWNVTISTFGNITTEVVP